MLKVNTIILNGYEIFGIINRCFFLIIHIGNELTKQHNRRSLNEVVGFYLNDLKTG